MRSGNTGPTPTTASQHPADLHLSGECAPPIKLAYSEMTEKTSPPRGIAILLYAFVKRTRNSQKIGNSSGRKAGIKSTFVLRKKAGNTCCCHRKKDPVAKNSAKHMRPRGCTRRCFPETPPAQ